MCDPRRETTIPTSSLARRRRSSVHVAQDRGRLAVCGTPKFGMRSANGKYLAYTVFGEGRTDLAIPSSRFPIDLIWEWPQLATFMEALGRLARVITLDNRGFGASDPTRDPTASDAEAFADDMGAVLSAADSERASIFEMGSGGVSCRVICGDVSRACPVTDNAQRAAVVSGVGRALGSPKEATRDEAPESGALEVRESARCA